MSILLNIDQSCRDAHPELGDSYVSALARALSQLSEDEQAMMYDEEVVYELFAPVMAKLDIPKSEWIPSLEPVIMRVMSRKYPNEQRYSLA